MYTKTLLLALSVAAFSSCSTAYKSGQTPDDVYYSPVRPDEESINNDRNDDKRDQATYRPAEDWQVRMAIRDRRWRDLDDYSYDNSPYNYCYCNCNHYTGYYYNPFFYPVPIYNVKINTVKLNNTPRMVNLNAYHNYNPAVANQKTSGTYWINPIRYNNSNTNSGRGLGNTIRRMVEPRTTTTSTTSSNNDSRSYTPSTNTSTNNNSSNNNSSSTSSSSSSSNSGSVSRPPRGN
jgi:hypothetical protein